MDDVEKKNINLLFESTPEEVLNLAERLGEINVGFTDDIDKITNHNNIFYVNSKREVSWQQGVIGTIHPAHLAHPALEYLLKRSSSGEFSVDMAESYEQFEKEVHAYRFIDPFEEGEIGDVIAQKMLDAGFDPLPFKTFHTALMGYVSHHVKRGNFLLPIDIQLGLFQGSVVVQCVVSSAVFTLEQVQESFGHIDINHPYKSLLKQCYDSCHILDITHADTAKKIVFTGVWCHDQYALPAGSFLYNSIKRLGVMIQELKKAEQLHLVFGKHDSKFNELRFSGDLPRRYGPDEFVETDHPYIVRLIIDHCRKILDENNEAAPTESEGLVRLLENFEDKALISKLNAKDWASALKALQDVSTRELLENSVNLNSKELQDDIFERVVSSLEDLSLNEATQIISGKIEEDQYSQIVKGSKEEESLTTITGVTDQIVEERTMIKGKREDLGRGSITVIKGGGADPLAGKGEFNVRISSDWEDKKKAALGKIRDKWVIAKESGAAPLDIENEMRLALSEELEISPESVGQLVRNVVTESKDEALANKNKNRADDIRQKMQEERFKQELAKRDQQIFKMKKIMDQFKLELVNRNKAVAITENTNTESTDQAASQALLQQEISRVAKELIEARAQIAQKDKEARIEVENQERKIKELESKIEFYKEKSGDTNEQKSEIHGLKRENTTLQNQAQLHQTRAEHLSQRMDKQREILENRDRKEFEKVSSRLAELESERQKTKDQLTRLEFMNRELEKKLVDKENELLRQRQTQSDTSEPGSDELYKKALKEIEEFKVREREAQQEAKALGLKVRQLEQKLKFTTAQLDKQSSKGAATAASNGAPSANEKRLDSINKKLADGMKSQANELAERKKEAIKLKAENNQLQHKLTDLERQLSKFSKAS